MSQLLAAIANRQSQARESAKRRYVEILRNDDPSMADEFMELLETLGMTKADVERDLKIIGGYRTLKDNLQRMEAEFKSGDLEEAKKQLEDFDVETFRLENQGKFDSGRVWGRQKLQLALNSVEVRRSSIIGTKGRLAEFRINHRDLLTGI
jgi:hypothetical protein